VNSLTLRALGTIRKIEGILPDLRSSAAGSTIRVMEKEGVLAIFGVGKSSSLFNRFWFCGVAMLLLLGRGVPWGVEKDAKAGWTAMVFWSERPVGEPAASLRSVSARSLTRH